MSITIDYVRSAAAMLQLPLSPAQAERVATHLERTQAMATMLQAAALNADDELAEIYKPAPFPVED